MTELELAGIDAGVASDLVGAIQLLPVDTLPAAEVLLPSSARVDDRVALAVRQALWPDASIAVPPAGAGRAMAELLRTRAWTRVTWRAPDQPARSARLPARLSGRPSVAVIDLDAVAAHGPFALDLLARYLHHFDRLRVLAGRHRASEVTDLNLGNRPSGAIILTSIDGDRIAAATRDLIAAELFALAFADQDRPGAALSGPWEDPLVQRATVLELGARIPDDIPVRVRSAARGVRTLEHIESCCARFGVVPVVTRIPDPGER